jgi:hypothetical protein
MELSDYCFFSGNLYFVSQMSGYAFAFISLLLAFGVLWHDRTSREG